MKLLIVATALFVAASAQLSAHEQWTSFKAEHNKVYTVNEDRVRFQVFQNNLVKIAEHNAKYENGESSFFLKVTQFADWTEDEFKSMLNSQMLTRPKNITNKTFVADPNFVRPESVDWREKAVLDVKDQGNCGSCWAFSTTGSLEGQLAIHKNKRVPLSEQELVDCDKEQNEGCNGGLMDAAFDYIKKNGLSSETQYKYTGREGNCKKVDDKEVKSISGFVDVGKTENDLADAVGSVGPVSVAVDADLLWQLYGGGVFDHILCGHQLNHGVLAVGYTDKYWIIKNSWGPRWGEKGYIRLVRGKEECGVDLMASYPTL